MLCILNACVLTAELVSGGTYTENTAKTATDNANVTHDIAHFYKVNNKQFNLNGYLILDTNTRIDLGYDNGLKSQKRVRTKSLNVSIKQLLGINNNSYLMLAATTQLGGVTKNKSCTDSSGLNKQFYCDNLKTSQPFEQYKHKTNKEISVSYNFRF